ncbi:MAG: methylmalonyl Co-A mutase-associated GTPase MeaB [Magnetococcales bacterium]|nr:methylmalonyl Co-A mutase-associated GTPase MeaB [Magnetococcales bacterium]
MTQSPPDISALVAGIRRGERRALAKAITLIESHRPQDDIAARHLLAALSPIPDTALRVAISGPPGVGKSTLIEALGLQAVARHLRTAVLTVDPSSRLSGGSILGDKTRMSRLSIHPLAFIRPTPAGETLGGVARRTRETMQLMEAAGFDLLLVETVGVGQSETEVADMVDIFVLVLQPNAGDELQGIKRGIMERADIVLVNKADGVAIPAAELTCAQVDAALALRGAVASAWQPRTVAVSALEERGMAETLDMFTTFRYTMTASAAWQNKRQVRNTAWMWDRVREGLLTRLLANDTVQNVLAELEPMVHNGELGPVEAAERLLDVFVGSGN